ncbi:hypothetical protein JTE90_014421 [Oedothorax gibbosus]|uniref:DUF3668 domain-containing protein n=1 Tax=Oedothorax gibbosus TaxID=931172 RepID=A0AAV6V0T1_9ARAC|nr:hypothetical protein JTE90_014421 [Oedothorax gibbosus]
MNTNFFIVISVLEGQNFPTRHDKYLLCEARFDGEVMSTDPVSHIMRPLFNTELAWEVDKKGLQMHRLQRSPIKLHWFAVDLDLVKKESIGYMILDIRLAQEKLQGPKWYPILSSKYQREKPEVLLSLYLEKAIDEIPQSIPNGHSSQNSRRNSLSHERGCKKTVPVSSRNPKQSPLKTPVQTPNVSIIPVLKPVLLSQAGCYQIGPSELCREKFNFSITLAFAANLNKLTPPAMLKSSKGFYFYYSLFDNDVTTEKFSSLSNPDFLAERASVRISSSTKLLAEYFEQNPNLEILLCCGDISLGSGQIPLGPLSCVHGRNINQEPLCIEGSVQITPTEKTSRCGGDDLSPFVGVTVVLQADKSEEESDLPKENATPPQANPIAQEPPHNFPMMTLKKTQNFTKGFSESEDMHPSQSSHSTKRAMSRQESVNATQNTGPDDPSSGSNNHSSDNTPPEMRDASSINSPPNSLPIKSDNGQQCHLFSFSLDLCNFKATRLAHPINLFIRYSYPFFGTNSAMVTHPDVEVTLKREVSIPHGYCSFDFATTFAQLKSTYWETPLILEVLHRKKGGQEQQVGTARINLFQVLDAPKVSHTVDEKKGMRQMSTCKVVVTSPEGYEIGEIYAALTLIDFGITSSSLCDHRSNQPTVSCYNEVRSFMPNFNVPLLRQNGLTQDELLQAALELELWQDRQRELFRAQLKDKEVQHLTVLTSQWKQRDMERELLLQRQIQECQKLENKLKSTLKDAELKEKQLSSQEAELSMRLRKIDGQQEQQKKENKLHIDKIKREFNELLTLERLNARDLEQKNNSLLQKMKELDRELQEQRTINDNLKSQVNKDPDVQLRTEVNILNMEKAELQQKLETVLSSKHKYKYQWSQAIRQIQLLQQKLHMMECLEKEKKDKIASFQQKMLSTEDKNSNQANEDILEMVNDKVESLKSVVSADNLQRQMRQMSMAMRSTETTPTSNVGQSRVNSNTMNRIPNGPIPNNIAKNVANSSNETLTAKQKTNTCNETNGLVTSPEQSSSNTNQFPAKHPTKHSPDMNGNTKDNNLHLQHLLTEKESLLIRGYTEQDKLIKDLNTHIDKAKNGFK